MFSNHQNTVKQTEDDEPIDMNYTNIYTSDKENNVDELSDLDENTSSQNDQNDHKLIKSISDDEDDMTQQINETELLFVSTLSVNITANQDQDQDTFSNDHDSDSEISVNAMPNEYAVIDEIQPVDKNNITGITQRARVFPDGYLKIVIGCMFSGKTTYLIRECKKWQSIGKHVLIINYSMDRRYTNENKVVSHDRYSTDCAMIDKFTPDLTSKIESYDVILINEGQFFKDLNQNVRRWCDDMKKIVVVSGLDGDYLRDKFGEILELIPDCDELIKLKALCAMCRDGTEAPFTWKTKDNSIEMNDVIDIGVDKYMPLCRKHYNKEKNKTFQQTQI